MSFHCEQIILSARKPHRCRQCRADIEKGSTYLKIAGHYEDFYSYSVHLECEKAARAYADFHGLYGEEWPWFVEGDFEREDRDWMREKFPLVAHRLDWDTEPCIDCDDNRADPPSQRCPGCDAYREHQA